MQGARSCPDNLKNILRVGLLCRLREVERAGEHVRAYAGLVDDDDLVVCDDGADTLSFGLFNKRMQSVGR